jgi:hypothetical protein
MSHAVSRKHREIVHDTLPKVPIIGRGNGQKGSRALPEKSKQPVGGPKVPHETLNIA